MRQIDAFVECSDLVHGFLRLRCADGSNDKLVAFCCKRGGFAPHVAPGAWCIPGQIWWTMSSRMGRCARCSDDLRSLQRSRLLGVHVRCRYAASRQRQLLADCRNRLAASLEQLSHPRTGHSRDLGVSRRRSSEP